MASSILNGLFTATARITRRLGAGLRGLLQVDEKASQERIKWQPIPHCPRLWERPVSGWADLERAL